MALNDDGQTLLETARKVSTTERTPEQFRKQAEQRLAGFEFTRVAHSDVAEVWHCQRPGTGDYHFDITVLPTGMAVTGDMTGLLFDVGAAYGIPFLRHTNKSYVAEKLEPQSRRKVFDRSYFMTIVARAAGRALVEEVFDGDSKPKWLEIPDALHEYDQPERCTPAAVQAFLEAVLKDERIAGEMRLDLQDMLEAIGDAADVEQTAEAYAFLGERKALRCGDDYYEFNLERLDPEVIQRLYVLEVAAERICDIRAREAATAAQPDRPRGG